MILTMLCWSIFVTSVHCLSYEIVTSTPELPRELNAVQHMQRFLQSVQSQVQRTRAILHNVPHAHFTNDQTADTTEHSELQKQVLRGIEEVMKSVGVESSGSQVRSAPVLNVLSDALHALLRVGAEYNPGDILSGIIARNLTTTTVNPYVESLQQELVQVSGGYLSVGFERMCEQIALKNASDATPVLRHTEPVISKSVNSGRMVWLEEPMLTILVGAARAASTMPIDELKSYAIMLHFAMVHRRSSISAEVNELIDAADDFVDPRDGDQLFRILSEFNDFPNVTKSGMQLCQDIFEAFVRPFVTNKRSSDLKNLVMLANNAFRERYPQLKTKAVRLVHNEGNYRSKRSRNRSSNSRRSYRGLPPPRKFISHERRRRRMNSDLLQAALATRSLVSIIDYNKVPRDRLTTSKRIRKYNKYEETPVRKLSMENNNFYREVSNEEFGDHKVQSESSEVKDMETAANNNYNDYTQDVGRDVTKYETQEITKAPHRFHLTRRDDYVSDNIYTTAGLQRKKLIDTTHDVITESYLFPDSKNKKRKRFSVINPLIISNHQSNEGHWVDTTKLSIQIRRTTQYTKPHIDRYKLFDRRTTEFKSHRRLNIPLHLSLTDNSHNISKMVQNKENETVITTERNTNELRTDMTTNYNINIINNIYLQTVPSALVGSGETTYVRADLIDQLVYNETLSKDNDKTVNVSIEIDNVEEILKSRLYKAFNSHNP